MIDIARLLSRRVAALGLTILILLVGVFLVLRVTSRPAYEATAEISLEIRIESIFTLDDGPISPPSPEFIAGVNREVDEVLESRLVAERAATLLSQTGLSFDGDASFVKENLSTDVHVFEARSGFVEVRFRADDPEVARLGADAIVEAYRQVRSAAPPGELEGDWEIWSRSLARMPSRIDTVNPRDVWVFMLMSMLAVYLTWKWWPDVGRQPERADHSDPVT